MADLKYENIEKTPLTYKKNFPRAKICYIILTCQKNIETRVKWQQETCFSNTDLSDCYYLSWTKGVPHIYGWNTDDDYKSCIIKYIKFFEHMTLDYDWYMFIDDDTFVFPTRAEQYISRFDCSKPLYIGYMWSHLKELRYMSGGAGFFISRPTYYMLKGFLSSQEHKNIREERTDNYGIAFGDTTIGAWIRELNRKNNYCITLLCDRKKLNPTGSKHLYDILSSVTFHEVKTEEDFLFYNNYLEELDISISDPILTKTIPPLNSLIIVTPHSQSNQALRHGYNKASFTSKNIGDKEDYLFYVRKSDDSSGVLFESLNKPGYYLAPKGNLVYIQNIRIAWTIEATDNGSKIKLDSSKVLTVANIGRGQSYISEIDTEQIQYFDIYILPTPAPIENQVFRLTVKKIKGEINMQRYLWLRN